MENLRFPIMKRFLTSEDITEIVGDAASDILLAEGFQFNDSDEYDVHYTNPGAGFGVKIKIDDTEPAETKNFAFALSFAPIYRLDSKHREIDPSRFNDLVYSGKIRSLGVTAGKINDSDLLEMENQILAQHKADKNVNAEKFEIRKGFIISDDDDSDASSVDITVDGVTTTIASDGAFGNLADKINASGAFDLLALNLGSDKVLITSEVKGVKFLVEDNADTTVIEHFLIANSLDFDKSYDVTFVDNDYVPISTVSQFFMMEIKSADWTAAGAKSVIYENNGDDSYAIASGANAGAVATAINAALTSSYATAVGTSVFLTEQDTKKLKSLKVRGNYESNISFGDYVMAGRGEFPTFDWYFVWKTFQAEADNHSFKTPINYVEKGAHYCVISLKTKRTQAALSEGASNTVGYQGRTQLVLKKSDVTSTLATKFNNVFGVNNF